MDFSDVLGERAERSAARGFGEGDLEVGEGESADIDTLIPCFNEWGPSTRKKLVHWSCSVESMQLVLREIESLSICCFVCELISRFSKKVPSDMNREKVNGHSTKSTEHSTVCPVSHFVFFFFLREMTHRY